MKKAASFLLLLSLLFGGVLISYDADAQIKKSRRSQKYRKNTSRITGYRGGAIRFAKRKRYNSIGASVNAMNYLGDLAPNPGLLSTDISFTRPGFSVFYMRRMRPRISIRAMYSYGVLKGNDFESTDPNNFDQRYRYTRNLHFRNRIHELSFVGILDLFPNAGSFVTRPQFNAFFVFGVAGFYHNPQAVVPTYNVHDPGYNASDPSSSAPSAMYANAGQWIDLEPLGTEGQYSDAYDVDTYSKIQFALPVGIGLRTRVSPSFDIEFEMTYRHLFTDYVDDVSQSYVDLGALADPLARSMSDRSQEHVDAVSGASRDLETIATFTEPYSYTSAFDGNTYDVIRGYGSEGRNNIRGDRSTDFYVMTSLRLVYILGGNVRRPKFR